MPRYYADGTHDAWMHNASTTEAEWHFCPSCQRPWPPRHPISNAKPHQLARFADWYMRRDHFGVDPDALEVAFIAGFQGHTIPKGARLAIRDQPRDLDELKAAHDAGTAAGQGRR